jgi:hypothetical protein
MCFDRIGTRQRQNFCHNHPPTATINGSYTRDVGMAKRYSGTYQFLNPPNGNGGTVVGTGSLAMFAVGDVLEFRGSWRNSGQRYVTGVIPPNYLTLDAPPQPDVLLAGEIRTP